MKSYIFNRPGVAGRNIIKKNILTGDRWQVTRDRWQMARDTWHIVLDEYSLKISAP